MSNNQERIKTVIGTLLVLFYLIISCEGIEGKKGDNILPSDRTSNDITLKYIRPNFRNNYQ